MPLWKHSEPIYTLQLLATVGLLKHRLVRYSCYCGLFESQELMQWSCCWAPLQSRVPAQVGLPDHLKFFQGHFVFQWDIVSYYPGRTQGEKRTFFPPMGIGTKKQKCVEDLKPASWFRLIELILPIKLCLPVWHSHYARASFTVLVWWACSSLTTTPSAGSRCNLRAHCSTVALCSVTTTWQRISKVTIVIACDCWPQISSAGDAARQWLQITVRRTFHTVWKAAGVNL